jgi:hypothetical protein
MTDRKSLRLAAVLLVLGEIVFVVAGVLHPAREPANSHLAVFAEYAESTIWTPVHLGQFVGAALILAGLIALVFALNIQSHGAGWLGRFAVVSAIATLALTAVLQAVDGVALKQAVDAWARAPLPEQAARFSSAELVRWLEWATRSYQYLMLGVTFLLVGTAIVWAGGVPRFIGYLAVLVGIAALTQGWVVGAEGFSETNTLPNLLGLVLELVWVVSVAVVAWRLKEPSTTTTHGSVGPSAGVLP